MLIQLQTYLTRKTETNKHSNKKILPSLSSFSTMTDNKLSSRYMPFHCIAFQNRINGTLKFHVSKKTVYIAKQIQGNLKNLFQGNPMCIFT